MAAYTPGISNLWTRKLNVWRGRGGGGGEVGARVEICVPSLGMESPRGVLSVMEVWSDLNF